MTSFDLGSENKNNKNISDDERITNKLELFVKSRATANIGINLPISTN